MINSDRKSALQSCCVFGHVNKCLKSIAILVALSLHSGCSSGENSIQPQPPTDNGGRISTQPQPPTDNGGRISTQPQPPTDNGGRISTQPQPPTDDSVGSSHPLPVKFRDGFEDANSFGALFPRDISLARWTHFSQTLRSNHLELESNIIHSGHKALRLVAPPGRSTVSKASILRGGFTVYEGQTVRLTNWVYIPKGQSLNNLFIIDLECGSCWPEKSRHSNPSPGIRLAFFRNEGYLMVERGKIGYRKGGTFYPPRGKMKAVPRDKWTRIDWVMSLSTREDGLTEVFLDGEKVLSARGVNIPNPDYLLSKFGVKLKRPIKYDRLEVGITANMTGEKITMYIDDIEMSLLPDKQQP